jgi:hypothetical protein
MMLQSLLSRPIPGIRTGRAAVALAALVALGAAQGAWGPGAASDLAARRAAAASGAAARSTLPAPQLPQLSADQIVERNVAARGGAAAWAAVKSMTLAGRMDGGPERKDGGRVAELSAPGARHSKVEARAAGLAAMKASAPVAPRQIQLPFRMSLQRPNQSRVEIDFQGLTAVQVWNGQNGWKLRPYLGRSEVEPFSDEETRLTAAQQELDGPLINHQAKGTQVALDGTEMVDGRPTYRLKLTYRNGDERRIWIDSQSFLDVMLEGDTRRIEGKVRRVMTLMRDFRPVGGVKVAHQTETRVEGIRVGEKIQIEQVVLNPALDPATFARPQPAVASAAAR